FFEMLGNFSFGDYFKRDAIIYAWDLLTRVYGLPAERLMVTIYQSDDEAYAIWANEVGVPKERIVRIGDNKGAPYASDNFWQMADTGPCGPCTEIFYDHGAHIPGGPPGSADEDGDRFIEIWNLVFMQFDRQADGTLLPLPAPCVDTGMGLERLAAVLQGVHSNYDIDLFRHLIAAAARETGCEDQADNSLKVIADHIRACAFLIIDGVLPSNEGRGYVLRRIIRRALRHGWKLGAEGLFFHRMVTPLVEAMGEAYPELRDRQAMVEAALKGEEERFAETLGTGMKVFEEVAAKSSGHIPGDEAFRLYDTYGFPLDLTADIARERGLGVDREGFDLAMEGQRQRARAASQFGGGTQLPAELVKGLTPTIFLGYDALAADGLRVVGLLREGRAVDELGEGEEGIVMLESTPFYAESGGQVGDTGNIEAPGLRFKVDDTQKLAGTFHGHIGRVVSGRLKLDQRVRAGVDGERRQAIVLNHSATHLLHAALRTVLGDHVQQKGSLVAPDRLRFDFSHFQPLSVEELARIEAMVNAEIRANAAAEARHMGFDEAIASGAVALFGEKYGERVRVLSMGGFSTELCGGTHVSRTGDIGLFRITAESGIAAGVRRIEAVTGAGALQWVSAQQQALAEVSRLLGGSGGEVVDKLRQTLDRQRQLERELEKLKARLAGSTTDDLASSALDIGGVKLVAARLDGMDAKALRDSVDRLKQKLGERSIVLLASGRDGKASLVAGVQGATDKVRAGDLMGFVAGAIGGKGGGRPDLAQGGGEDGPGLSAILAKVPEWVEQRLAS
ncbi:MAG TPA: alanine--tRNA ligase, partial [Xanthomonadaceae bacterium]|nr:alanine--tRNA ligase [Xanthomonadaceae bacterium]